MKKLFLMTLITLISFSCGTTGKSDKSTKKAQLYYTQGTSELIDQNYTNALKNLLEAYKYAPKDTKVLNNLGMAYYFKKSVHNAKKFIKMAIQVDPKNSDARMNFATILMEEKKFTAAETQYNKILNDLVFSRQYKTYHNLAKLEQKRGNTPKAKAYLAKSIEANENYCPAYFDLGKIQFNEEDYAKAQKNFKEASMGLCYKSPEPRFYRAKTYVKQNQYFEATQILEEMTETFALTKWESIARKGINKIKRIHNKEVLDTLEAKNTKKVITTPDF